MICYALKIAQNLYRNHNAKFEIDRTKLYILHTDERTEFNYKKDSISNVQNIYISFVKNHETFYGNTESKGFVIFIQMFIFHITFYFTIIFNVGRNIFYCNDIIQVDLMALNKSDHV